MRPRHWLLCGLFLALFISAPPPCPAASFPAPKGSPADYANVIKPPYDAKITEACRELLARTGVNLVVATIPDLGGADMERKAAVLFNEWGVGAKSPKGGVLVLLSLKERAGSIQFSPGLAAVLDDDTREMIQSQALLPDLRKNQFGQGLYQGACAISHVLAKSSGVKLPGVPQVRLQENRELLGLEKVWFLVALVLVIGWLRRRSKRRAGKTGAAPVRAKPGLPSLTGMFKRLTRSPSRKGTSEPPASGFRPFGGGGFSGFGGV